MQDSEVVQVILDIIRDILPDEDTSGVDPAVRLRDQVDLDSMDFLDIVMELRKRHQIDVPEEDYMELSTLNGCVAYLKPRMEARAAAGP